MTDSILELESTLHSHFPQYPEDAIQRQMLSVLHKVDFEVPPEAGLGMTHSQIASFAEANSSDNQDTAANTAQPKESDTDNTASSWARYSRFTNCSIL